MEPDGSPNWPPNIVTLADKLHALGLEKPHAVVAIEVLVDDYLEDL